MIKYLINSGVLALLIVVGGVAAVVDYDYHKRANAWPQAFKICDGLDGYLDCWERDGGWTCKCVVDLCSGQTTPMAPEELPDLGGHP